jgi:hypothetical protein
MQNPLSLDIDKWLRSIDPRQELVVRLALRGKYQAVRGDRAFGARIDELWAQLNPNHDMMYASLVLDAALATQRQVEKLLLV